jgi:hypothetical protein
MPIALPPELARLVSKTGKHKAGKKILGYAKWKRGKSEAASSMPNPIFALACGEPGIVPYLQPDKGDVGLEIYNPDDMFRALDYAYKHADQFPSVAIDNVNLGWSQHLDAEEEKRESAEARERSGVGRGDTGIQKHEWSAVKANWFDFLHKTGQSPQNVFLTAWVQDVVYRKVAVAVGPGIADKVSTVPMEADVPKTEKTVPYYPDLIFGFNAVEDKLGHLTEVIEVTFRGGRVPPNIPPEMLHLGKTWKINTRKDPRRCFWDKVIMPLDPYWKEGEVEVIGLDAAEVERGRAEVGRVHDNAEVGRLLTKIGDFAGTLDAYSKLWTAELVGPMQELPPKQKALVREAHERKKKELGV